MRKRWLRAGLVALAVSSAVVGCWALIAPRSFFDDFPGGGHSWVSALPPYNEHLVRDVGSLNLALAVLLAWAAVSLSRSLVLGALAATLVNAVPHFVYHLTERGALSRTEQAESLVALGLVVVLPCALLPLVKRASD